MSNRKSALRRWVIPGALGAAMFFWLLLSRGGPEAPDSETFLRILCDALFIPGAVLGCVGLLAVCAGHGAFDAVSFGVKKLFSLLRSEEKRATMPKTYYDYVTARRESVKPAPAGLLTVGGVMAAAAVIVLIFYYRAAG